MNKGAIMNIDTFIVQYGLLAIFLLLFTKAIGIPIPIPADLILLAAAVGAAQQKFNLWLAIVVILIAVVFGGIIQFLLARGLGRALLFRFGRYLGLTPARLDAASARVQKGGIIGISITMLIPGIRGVAIVAAGLAGLPFGIFVAGLVIGSALFLSVHFFLGYLGGSLLTMIGNILPPVPILVLLVIMLVIIFALWTIAFYRQKSARREQNAAIAEMWHEGICPACLALSVMSPLQQIGKEAEQ
jgi:membrane protein DedA with SNARE-associated domain